jgi:hypothetical protein
LAVAVNHIDLHDLVTNLNDASRNRGSVIDLKRQLARVNRLHKIRGLVLLRAKPRQVQDRGINQFIERTHAPTALNTSSAAFAVLFFGCKPSDRA